MVMLKLEDYIWNTGPKYEYVNSDKICRIRFTRKRIRIYFYPSMFGYIYVAKTKHNLDELENIDGLLQEVDDTW